MRALDLLLKATSLLRQQGWWLLVAVILLAAALSGFAELADEVADGETRAFDRALMLSMREAGDPDEPIGPAWVELVARDITSLGGTAVLTLLAIATVGFMLLNRRWGGAIFVVVSVAGGALISAGLKGLFGRPRPDLVPHAVEVTSASFPSGHAMLAVVTYLTLGALLAQVQPQRRFKVYILSWAIGLSLLVGMSRIYLGVHWPTDVLAGWCIGSAWALGCGTVAYWLQRRGVIESRNQPQ